MKVLFLDVDGVLNCEGTFRLTKPDDWIPLDPYMGLLLYRIIQATNAKVVLSSSWRGYTDGEEEIQRMIGERLSHLQAKLM